MLDSLHIKNFRCFEDLTIPSLGRVNLIVGKNNSGKSTLLEALVVFASGAKQESMEAILKHRNMLSKDLENKLSQLSFLPETQGHFSHDLLKPLLRNVASKSFEINDLNYSIETGVVFPSGTEKSFNHAWVSTSIHPENEIAVLWDSAYLNADDDIIKESLKILVPKINSLAFAGERGRICYIKLIGMSQAQPLKSLGEGAYRLLQLFLNALQARNGYLLIDEFENGLHYSIQEEVWAKLFQLARELDIQVFATTHSQDTVKAFSKVALASPEEGRIIYLGRHNREADPDKGKISALVYDESDMEMIIQTGMEVR